MDPTIGWYQPEQFGPAKDLWLNIWEAEKGLDILTLRHDNNGVIGGGTGSSGGGGGGSSSSCVGVGNCIGGGGSGNSGSNNSGNSSGQTAMATNKSGQDFISLDNTVNNRIIDDRITVNQRGQHNSCNNYYNPSRRKSDNRASTYGMNYNHDALVGVHGGCPWRIPNKQYSKGVIGYNI